MKNLRLPIDSNCILAKDAVPYQATIWDRLDPITRRQVNVFKDHIPKEEK